MKKINKLQFNPKKLMKNMELLTLKGGYDGPECCECHIIGGSTYYITSTPALCNGDCYAQYYGWGLWQCIV